MGEVPKCRLCIDSNVPPAEADLFATVPMCGKRPRYPLCLPCYEDIAEGNSRKRWIVGAKTAFPTNNPTDIVGRWANNNG